MRTQNSYEIKLTVRTDIGTYTLVRQLRCDFAAESLLEKVGEIVQGECERFKGYQPIITNLKITGSVFNLGTETRG